MSKHKEKGVGCEKCHGGDPKVSDEKKAHAGVIMPRDANSRLHPQNPPETCNACHPGIVSSFVESRHYQKLKSAGLGPSCTTCTNIWHHKCYTHLRRPLPCALHVTTLPIN